MTEALRRTAFFFLNHSFETPRKSRLNVLILLRLFFFPMLLLCSTNVWMPRVKIKSFGWAANRNQPQHRLKFVVTITQ